LSVAQTPTRPFGSEADMAGPTKHKTASTTKILRSIVGLGDQGLDEQTVLEALILELMVGGTQFLVPLTRVEGQRPGIASPGRESKCRCACGTREAFGVVQQQRADASADEGRLHIEAAQLGRGTHGDKSMGCAQGDACERHQVPLPLGEQHPHFLPGFANKDVAHGA